MNLVGGKWKVTNNKKINISYSNNLKISNNTDEYGTVIYPKMIHLKKNASKNFSFFGESTSKIHLKIVSAFKKTEAIIPLNTNETINSSGYYFVLIIVPPNSNTIIDVIEYSENNFVIEKLLNVINHLDIKINEIAINQKKNEEIIENQNKKILAKLNSFNFELLSYNNNKQKILIVGFYGGYNLGDELMLQTLLKHLEKFDNLELTVMIADNASYNIDEFKNVRFIHFLNDELN